MESFQTGEHSHCGRLTHPNSRSFCAQDPPRPPPVCSSSAFHLYPLAHPSISWQTKHVRKQRVLGLGRKHQRWPEVKEKGTHREESLLHDLPRSPSLTTAPPFPTGPGLAPITEADARMLSHVLLLVLFKMQQQQQIREATSGPQAAPSLCPGGANG